MKMKGVKKRDKQKELLQIGLYKRMKQSTEKKSIKKMKIVHQPNQKNLLKVVTKIYTQTKTSQN